MPRRFRLLAAASAFLAASCIPWPVAATPPQPPLELRLVLLESPRPGRTVGFAIEATALVPAERLRLRLTLPRDVTLARGDSLATVADPMPGRPHRFEGAFRLPPGQRRHVRVRAEIVTPGGATWTRGAHLELLAGMPATPDPVGRAVPDGRGGTLVEYDGEADRGRP